MFKYGLYLCCLVSLILICACGKREMTDKDIAVFKKLIDKYDDAKRKDDYQGIADSWHLIARK